MHIVDKNGSKFESFLTRRKLAFLFKEKMLFADVHWVMPSIHTRKIMKNEIVMGIFRNLTVLSFVI